MSIKISIAAVSVLAVLAVLSAPVGAATPEEQSEQLALLNAINEHEIDAAKEAKSRDLPAPVAQYAQTMIDAHQQNITDTEDLAEQVDIDINETEAVKAFKEQNEAKLDSLKEIDDDGQFAARYTQGVIAAHEETIEQLDNFIRNSDGEVKEHFTQTRAHVNAHLQQAQKLNTSIR